MNDNDFGRKFEAAVQGLGDTPPTADNLLQIRLNPPTRVWDFRSRQTPTYTRHCLKGKEFDLVERNYLSAGDWYQVRMRLYEHIRHAPEIPLDEPLGIVHGFEYLALRWNIELPQGVAIRLMAEILAKNCLEATVSLSQGLLQVRGHVNGNNQALHFRLERSPESPSDFVMNALRIFKSSLASVVRY